MNECLVKLPAVVDNNSTLMRSSSDIDQQRARQKIDLSAYFKPASEGWRRECKMTANKIDKVYYLSPLDSEGNFKRLETIISCIERCGSDSKLSRNNFTFVPRKLGLSSEFEVVRRSESIHSQPFVRMAMLEKYFILTDEVNSSGKKMVTCNLCNITVTLKYFTTHMRRCHLPDEICPTCGIEVPSLRLSIHIKTNHINSIWNNIYLSSPSTTSLDPVTEASKLISNQGIILEKNKSSSGLECPPFPDPYYDAPENNEQKNEINVVLPREISLEIKLVSEKQDSHSVTGDNAGSQNSECTSSNTSNIPVHNIVITFIFSHLNIRKRLKIRDDKPMSKAINKITKVMGLSPDLMTFKSGNFVLTGTELVQDLVSPNIVAERI